MAKQYECCMIYENRRGNPAREKIAELRNRKTVKNIYPSEKPDIGKTPDDVLKNSKKYAVFLTEDDDFNPARAFCQNIERAASLTRDSRKKKILYTILDGDRDAEAVLNVKDMLEGIPPKRQIYLKKYTPEKMEKYILGETPAVKIRVVAVWLISAFLLASGLSIAFKNDINFIQKAITWGSNFFSHSIGVLGDLLDLNVNPDSSDLITVNSPVTGVILATPIPIIWLALLQRETRSVNPLFWMNLRRYITLFLLLFYTFCYKSADLDATRVADSNIALDFERIVVKDLYGQSDNITVPINDMLEPSGKLWIKENGKDLLASEADKPFRQHLKDCPPLQEGHSYIIRWESDSTKAGQKEFCHHKAEPVVIEIESEDSDFEDITKAQFREYAEKYKIEFSEEFKMYYEDGHRALELNIENAGESERVFTTDIATACFKLKDEHNEIIFIFGIDSDPNNTKDISKVPSGQLPVTIEFED